MARIRSIKPDFFTSETIAGLPLSARLTFIGLWTYVDDNGVGLDNALLVTAAVWPLESDNLETLERTRDDLARIARKGLISRYQDSRKHYLHVTNWKEHQKVDHPGKPRYPLPGDPAVTTIPTCDNSDESRTSPESSREPRESVAPEQGAGSREQGKEQGGGSGGEPTDAPQTAAPKRRGTRIPDNFPVTAEMVAWARERCPHVDGKRETEKFINHFQAKSGREAVKLDWVLTWKNWMLTAAERTSRPPPGGASSQVSPREEHMRRR